MHFASFTKRHSSNLSRSVSRKLSNMIRHKSGDWEAAAAAAQSAVAAEAAAAGKRAAEGSDGGAAVGDKVSEPERTQFYLRQGKCGLCLGALA